MKFRPLACAYLTLLSVAFVTGCSQESIKTVPVYGTLKFVDRQQPELCDIIFQPQKVDGPVRPSFTEMQPDGSYRVTAFKNSKGLIPGTYRIQLVAKDLKPGSDPKVDANWKHSKYDGGEVNVDATSGGVEHVIEVKTKKS
jgi:hypothetical protein